MTIVYIKLHINAPPSPPSPPLRVRRGGDLRKGGSESKYDLNT